MAHSGFLEALALPHLATSALRMVFAAPGLLPLPARTASALSDGRSASGTVIGPASTKEEIEIFRARVQANPANYIAQPTLSLSTCPTNSP